MRFNINHCNVRFLNPVVESWYHIVLRTYNLQKDIPRSKCFPFFLFPFGDTACIHERWHRGHQYRWPAKSTMKAWYMSQLKSTHTLEAENRPRAFVRSSDCTEADFWVFDTTLVTVVNERDMKIVIRHDGITARGKMTEGTKQGCDNTTEPFDCCEWEEWTNNRGIGESLPNLGYVGYAYYL